MQLIRKIYRFMAIFMAVLIFITSVGFIVDFHFCSGQLKSLSLIGKAKTCHEKAASSCPHHRKRVQKDTTAQVDDLWNCCTNKIAYWHLEQDKKKIVIELKLSSAAHYFALISKALFTFTTSSDQDLLNGQFYRPPPILRNIIILVQSFLL